MVDDKYILGILQISSNFTYVKNIIQRNNTYLFRLQIYNFQNSTAKKNMKFAQNLFYYLILFPVQHLPVQLISYLPQKCFFFILGPKRLNIIILMFQYFYQLSGIRCIACVNKINQALIGFRSIKDVRINLLNEQVTLTLENNDDIEHVSNKLKEINMTIIKQYMIDSDNASKTLYFRSDMNLDYVETFQIINLTEGIQKVHQYFHEKVIDWEVTFNQSLISAKTVYEIGLKHQLHFIDNNLEVFKIKKYSKSNNFGLYKMLAIYLSFLLISFVLMEKLQNVSSYEKLIILLAFFFFSILFTKSYGQEYYKHAILGLLSLQYPNMDTLIFLGSFCGFIMSIISFIDDYQQQFSMIIHCLQMCCSVIAIMSTGKFLEKQQKQQIQEMTHQIFPTDKLSQNPNAMVVQIKNKRLDILSQHEYPVSLVEEQDLVLLEKDQRLLFDVRIVQTQEMKAIDSQIYGDDKSFTVQNGQILKAGSEIKEGNGMGQVVNSFENSSLAKIAFQLAETQSQKQQGQSNEIIGKITEKFVLFVILLAIFIYLVWNVLIYYFEFELKETCKWCFPLERALSLIVTSCPCALGLAIPIVIIVTLNIALKNGILIKDVSVIKNLKSINTIVFDKTGTLFDNISQIKEQTLISQLFTEEQIWHIIYTMEKDSQHPLGLFLTQQGQKYVTGKQVTFYRECLRFENKWLIGEIKNKENESIEVLFGNKQLLNDYCVPFEQETMDKIQKAEEQCNTVLLLCLNRQLAYVIQIENSTQLNPKACYVINELQKNKKVCILSGDSQETVNNLGRKLNIQPQNLYGGKTNEQKEQILLELQNQGDQIMMVGDGLNDVLSLQTALVGVSINAKTELNLVAAQVIILNSKLDSILVLFKLLKFSYLFMKINLFWAFAYNICMMPLAIGFFYNSGIVINPIVSSILMQTSSLIVVTFSQLLKFVKIHKKESKMTKEEYLQLNELNN